MADDRRESDRETVSPPAAAERKTVPSPSFPFPYIPPSTTLNETFSGYLKNREGEGEHSRQKRSRSHSRSASSISNLLLVATERLGQETSRANALDVRCAEVLAHLRTIVGERDQLRRTLTKVQEELSMYKIQLDVAQNEIFRAQKIVDGVDKARVEAEEQAAKDRTLARQLVSERAVWVAREEGRNEGFKEGLRQGRRWAAARKRTRAEDYTEDNYEGVDQDPEAYEPSARNSSPSSQRHWSSPARSIHSALPDAASYASTLPMHAMTPPESSTNVPSTESHQPSHQPPRPASAKYPERSSYPERSPSARSSRPLPRAPEHLPEPIDIRRDRRTFRAPSPTMSHRSVAPPPDGFIPTVGADSVISLPPPHELSRPVSIVGDTPASDRGGPVTPHGGRRARTMSNVSAVSTRLSQFDILSPPRASEAPVTRSDQVAHEWRIANAAPPERRPRTTEDFNGSENFSTHSSISHSQASRRSGPRRPREIVMPMPLSTSIQDAMRPSTSAAPQHDLLHASYGYAAPAGASSSSAPTTAFYAPPPAGAPPPHQEYSDDTTPARPRSAIAWIKSRFNRSVSSTSVPNIQIEPPSNPASNPSTDYTVNTILLSPEDAGNATLPQQFVPELAGAVAGVQLQPAPAQVDSGTGTGTGNVIVLPDNELPRGFIPLSPILPNLHSVPPSVFTIDPFPITAAPAPPPAPAPAATPSPQPPAYSPRDIYAPAPPRPSTAAGMRKKEFDLGMGSSSTTGRARGASIGSAMLQMSPPLNRPISLFSEA
ncbi:hypothetical protein B0H19DRAFT_716024 [Mycena capillaripes]|nr:hypothetical protein B0H19DRAFT_716024 [Mycena capillaripes]